MLKERTDAYIDGVKGRMIEDIIQLVGFPSINGQKEENTACLRFFLKRAEELGFRTMNTSTWDVGIVEMGRGDETLGILVHLDVVGIGDREKWTNDPFTGVIRDGFIWGRGTIDDKGAAIMSLYAMKAVQLLNQPMHRKVWLIVGTSEEAEWTDIANYKKEFRLPDYGYTPDGVFPIFNAEKGYADIILDFSRDKHRGLKQISGGDSSNTIPSKAEIILPDGRHLIANGVSAHSSEPESGDNAIIKLCKILSDVGGLEYDFVRFTNQYLDNDGFADALQIDDSSEQRDTDPVNTTTIVPTVISLEQRSVRLNINIRFKPGTTRKEILDAFSAHSSEFGYSLSVLYFLDPMIVNGDQLFLKIMQEVSEEYGIDSSFKQAPGTTYAKSVENFVSWGPLFSSDPQTAHVEDERLSVDTMILASKLYARYICRMALGG